MSLLSAGLSEDVATYTDSPGTVIEAFERADPLAQYDGATTGWTGNTTDPIEGGTSLEGTQTYYAIATNQVSTPRSNEYIVRVQLQSDSFPYVRTNVQSSTSPANSNYEFRLGPAYDVIEIHERDSTGSPTLLTSSGYDFGGGASGTGPSGGGRYHIGCQVGEDTLRLRLYDAKMNFLVETEAVEPITQLSGGYLGFDSGDNPGAMLDRVAQDPLALDPSITMLDDFSHNDSTRYSGDTTGWSFTNGEASATATYREVSSSHVPTPRGEEYLIDVTWPAAGQYHKFLCNVQDPTAPLQNSYEVRISPDSGIMQLYENVAGAGTYLGETAVTVATSTPYVVGIEMSADRFRLNFYDSNMNTLAQSSPFATTTHTGGYYGFGSGNSDSMIVDNIRSRATGLGSGSTGGTGGVPSDLSGTYSLSYEDDFDGTGTGVTGVAGLDGTSWEVGYGWGLTSNNHDGEVTTNNISVSNSNLILEVTDNHPDAGMYYTGAICSHNARTFAPEDAPGNAIYMEARIKNPDLPGMLPAWWSKLESQYAGAWPPEIDFYELLLSNPPHSDQPFETQHHLHYNSSTNCGGDGTHTDHWNGNYLLADADFQDNYHVFGFLWDRANSTLAHYVDGNRVGATSDATINASMNNCTPFYQMFWMGIGHVWPGNPPSDWTGYDTTMEVDWVREYRRQ